MMNIKTETMLAELLEFYSRRELSDLSGISTQQLSRMCRDSTIISDKMARKLEKVFDMHVMNHSEELTIPEIINNINKNNSRYIIESPDSWVEIVDTIIKAVQPCRRILADEFSVDCSDRHLIQKPNDEWIHADELNVGDEVLTKRGAVKITSISPLENQLVYDVSVNSKNHRYWSGGISSHNTFKTGFVLQILANAQKKGMYVVIFDSEGAIDPESAKSFGLDLTKVKYVQMRSIEETRNAIYQLGERIKEKKAEGKFIIAIDSLANGQSELELKRMDKDNTSADMGTFAKSIKSLLKTATNMASFTKTPIIMTNHVYDDPSAMFPSLEKNMPGGKTVIYLPSVTVQLGRKLIKDDEASKIVDTKLAASQKSYSGVIINILTVKNRFIKQYLTGEVYLSFSKGLNKYYGLLDLFKGMGVLTNAGAWYTDWEGNKIGTYKTFSRDYDLLDNRLIPELDSRIMAEWRYGNLKDEEEEIPMEEHDLDESDEKVEESMTPLEKLKGLKKKVSATIDDIEKEEKDTNNE